MKGTTAVCKTRRPTKGEMDECRKYFMSDPDHWDPGGQAEGGQRALPWPLWPLGRAPGGEKRGS